jgi:voltage-gated potassium channel
MGRWKVVERRMSRFLSEPVSVRNAASLITVATALVVLASGALMRLLDHSEYPTFGRGLWWAMQTVTTVGYGDVTPEKTSGRIVAALVMLWGIAFVSILVAAITSSFVARATRERDKSAAREHETEHDQEQARFDELVARLDRLEQALSRIAKP